MSLITYAKKEQANFKPLQPLTGKDDEWVNVGGIDGNLYQNKMNSAVFKDSKDDKPYYIDAYVKETPNGHRWHGRLNLKDGRSVGPCYIKDFSKIPTVVVKVLERETEKDNWYIWIEDESQLEELAKYYEFEIK